MRALIRNPIACLTVCLAAALCVPLSAGEPETWTHWRGDAGDGSTPNRLPATLAGLEREWRVDLGKGYPGPIVAADRVFVVETVEDEDIRIRALDRSSGKELWTAGWASTGEVPFFAARNGDWVRSTPAWDGKRLYVGDMQEVLVALDGETGGVLWKIDFPGTYETPVPPFGFVSSPLSDGESVWVQAADSMFRLDAATGEVIWRALASATDIMSGGAFSSPAFAEIDGERQLLIQTRTTLHGLDPEDGTVLWSHDVPSFRGMNILTPLAWNDHVFTSTYRNNSFMFRLGGSGDTRTVSEAWTNPAAAYMSSPVVIGGHAYVHLGNGRVDCIDLATGESRWRSGDTFGQYWSMVHGRDGQGRATILALNETGELFLIDPDTEAFRLREWREVADAETWGHVAVAGGQLFVRELEGLSVWRWSAGTGKQRAGASGN